MVTIKQERDTVFDTNLKCSTCNMNLGAKTDEHGPWRLKHGQAIHHCDGSTVAFGAKKLNAHHTLSPWGNCWKCHEPLGCPKCVASVVTEILCEQCLVWGTIDAFLLHGPLSNDLPQLRKRNNRRAPAAREYPQAWILPFIHSEQEFRNSLGPGNTHTLAMAKIFPMLEQYGDLLKTPQMALDSREYDDEGDVSFEER